MPTAQEYLKRAEQCAELAKASTELYEKRVMEELVIEFPKAAERLEAHRSRSTARTLANKPHVRFRCRQSGQR